MPIYEYQCQACGARHEALQKIADAPLTDCPECGAAALRKMVTAAAFKLSGTGWYETDFKNSGKAPKKDDKAGASKDGAAAKSAETKGGSDKSSSDSTGSSKSAS